MPRDGRGVLRLSPQPEQEIVRILNATKQGQRKAIEAAFAHATQRQSRFVYFRKAEGKESTG